MARRTRRPRPTRLGEAEQAVMDYVWAHGPVSAEDCREGLRTAWPMKESTVRTVLTRLEAKRYVTHETKDRAYIYRAAEAQASVAARAVQHIIDRLCGGSAEQLVIGMVDHAVLDAHDLARLARRIAKQRSRKP